MKIIEREIPQPMEIYRHFKGNRYVIMSGEAMNCTNDDIHSNENFVVYCDLLGRYYYICKQSEFLSPVDKEKYPDAGQEWCFKKVGKVF